jgi:hypothetical protein
MSTNADWREVHGLRWHAQGYASVHGELLARMEQLDARFLRWAREEHATAYRSAGLLPLADLRRARYLQGFPHLAVFPARLSPEAAPLRAVAAASATADGLELPFATACDSILPPAACFQVYAALQDSQLDAAHVATVCCTCHRNEADHAWLRRQRAFAMRELVCVGTRAEVDAFLARNRARVDAFARTLGLDARWALATDPFFEAEREPRHLAQRLEPLKHELRLHDGLALCSVNDHRNFFGEGFGIRRDGESAHSGCVAFGLERWLYALIEAFGSDCRGWPALDAGA